MGEPGAGKTTLLLELTRDLLDQAKQDERHLIPVVFHLSLWAEQRLPLVDCLMDELNFALRLVLWQNHFAPLNYVRFLDYAIARIFLRKVGSGKVRFRSRQPFGALASLAC